VPYLGIAWFYLKTLKLWDRFDLVSIQNPQLGLSVPSAKLVCTAHTTALGEARALSASASSSWHVARALSRRTVGVWLERGVYRRAQRIIAISEHVARELIDGYGIPEERISVIGTGVDCDQFRPHGARPEGNREELRVLYVGRLVPRKNVGLLLDAMACADTAIRCRIVGSGTLDASLRRRASELGLATRVEFRGPRKGQELLDEYHWADVFVMSSNYEGMPLVMLEAMACGLPIVSMPFAGCKEIVSADTGIVLREVSAVALARGLEVLSRDAASLERMGRRAREVALERFSWESVCRRVYNVHEGCVSL
jgi:glycosyltransferase involved in cell wall biosynthesis